MESVERCYIDIDHFWKKSSLSGRLAKLDVDLEIYTIKIFKLPHRLLYHLSKEEEKASKNVLISY